MSKLPWGQWFWGAWMSDPGLRKCSVAARGLWMDMLCVAGQHVPIGYVAVNGEGLSEEDIGRIAGVDPTSVATLISELDRNGVFSRNTNGTIYSRRMVREAKRRAEKQKNGSLGGRPPTKENHNPNLPLSSNSILLEFEEWWSRYPLKVGKGAAEKSFLRAKSDFSVTLESLLRAVDSYIASKPKDQAYCHPTTWLNQRRWEDVQAGAKESDDARFRRMLEHKRDTGLWPWKTPESEIPESIRAEFQN